MLQPSSAEIFGEPGHVPAGRATRPSARSSPYGASKAFAHHVGRGRAVARAVHRDRHPLQPRVAAPPDHLRHPQDHQHGAPRSPRGRADRLTLGNLDARRDWGWAPDYVDAMVRAARHDVPGDYVVATGRRPQRARVRGRGVRARRGRRLGAPGRGARRLHPAGRPEPAGRRRHGGRASGSAGRRRSASRTSSGGWSTPRGRRRERCPAPRVAIAHDYLTQRGGAERVVLAMARAFPEARIHTTLYDPEGTYPEFADHDIVTSPLNRIGPVRRDHRLGLPLLAPRRLRPFEVDADVVLVSSSGWAHGFRHTGRTLVYCYSPARWLYQTDTYLGGPAEPLGDRAGPARAAPRAAPLGRPGRPPHRPLPRDLPGRARPDRGDLRHRRRRRARAAQHGRRRRAGRRCRARGLGEHRRLPPRGLAAAAVQERRRRRGCRARHRAPARRRRRRARAATPCSPPMPGNVRLLSGLTDAQLRWVYAHSTPPGRAEHRGLRPVAAGGRGLRPAEPDAARRGLPRHRASRASPGCTSTPRMPALFRAGLAAAAPTRGMPACCARTPRGSPRRASPPGCMPRSTTSCAPAERPAGGRRHPRPACDAPSAERPVLDLGLSRPPVGDPGHARYWSGRLPSRTRGRPSDARHDVAKVP